ncbi:MAG: ribosomal-processing cysteine protease Prp [Clostridia bacterium]|nr:ribosomal-processing cysteine protease Prp [Clostridia bacterium]
MVNITFCNGGGKSPMRLEMKGHAHYGKPGEDVLCSALSILMHTAAKTVVDLEQAGQLLEEPTVTLSPGQGYLELVPKPMFAGKALAEIGTVARGLKLLEAYYPRYVKFTQC